MFRGTNKRRYEKMKKESIINLNHQSIFIAKMPFGKTQNIICRLGRRLYMLDVDKNACTVRINFYCRLNSERKKYSKYEPAAHCSGVTVSKKAILDRKFFENIYKISAAQNTCNMYAEYIH